MMSYKKWTDELKSAKEELLGEIEKLKVHLVKFEETTPHVENIVAIVKDVEKVIEFN